MNKADRYKRNYRLIRNEYNDPKLARKARTWSDERLYNELGIKTTIKKEPKLKELSTNDSYYERKLDHFKYARNQGLDVKEAKRLTKYSKKKIKAQATYYELKRPIKDPTIQKDRNIEWKRWTKSNALPPSVRKDAIQINKDLGLDDYDKYGFAKAYYLFIENGDEEKVNNILAPDPFDTYNVIYLQEVRPVY